MKKTRHDGDCSVYSSLVNGRPEDGICTCGYGHQMKFKGGDYFPYMYSQERLEKDKRMAALDDKLRQTMPRGRK